MEWPNIPNNATVGAVIGAIIAWITSILTNKAADKRQNKQLAHDREQEQFKSKRTLMTERGEEIYQRLFEDQTHLLLLNGNYINMLESAIKGDLNEIESALDFAGSLRKDDAPQFLKDGARLSLLQAMYFRNIENDCKKYLELRDSIMKGTSDNMLTIIPLQIAKETQALQLLLDQAKALDTELSECNNRILKSIIEEVQRFQDLPQSMPSSK